MLINAPLPRQTLESTAPKRVCLFFELKKIYKIQYVTSASEGDPGERKGPAPNLTNSEKCKLAASIPEFESKLSWRFEAYRRAARMRVKF
ncbi:MAG: hypothetical protein EBS52_11940 [Betaproteobacteria bacterium]|nr:hypothetical protein [Betaproteobacteria bacterium]